MGLGGLGGHDDLGAILSGLQGYGLADAAAGAGDVQDLPGEFSGRGGRSRVQARKAEIKCTVKYKRLR